MSSLVEKVKKSQYEDPMLVHHRDVLPQKKESLFEVPADRVLKYHGRLCVPDVARLRRQIFEEAHHSHYSVHPREKKMAASSRSRVFLYLDPPIFTGSNSKEDPQDCIDHMGRALRVMYSSNTELVELASYRLRDVAAVWYESWLMSRGENAPPMVWFEFTKAFLAHYFPVEIRRARVDKFLSLQQNNMSAREYSLKFNSLTRYAPAIIAEMEDRAYAQNLEDRIRQQRAEQNPDRGRYKRARSAGYSGDYQGGYKPHSFRRPAPSVVSAPTQFQGQRYDRSTYSGPCQNSKASRSSHRGGLSQARPPLPHCDQCGKGHFV
ncbi:uncharacterized protein LOC132630731 [Lycium barbarum]|uniref:uncharacterized protein LOC132630731 n=1 Tax=Lycium barbarum TaxID=112863 RepID=UPI00293E3666|nr:uncharacterized protein LOC132630731 [Lycium barbarum]